MGYGSIIQDNTSADVQAARWNQRQDTAIKSAIEFLIEGAKMSKYCDDKTLSRGNLSRRLEKILNSAPDQSFARLLLPRRKDFESSRRLSEILEPVWEQGFDRTRARFLIRGDDSEALPRLSNLDAGRARKSKDAGIQTSRSLEAGLFTAMVSDNSQTLSETKAEVVIRSQSTNDAAFDVKMDKLITDVINFFL